MAGRTPLDWNVILRDACLPGGRAYQAAWAALYDAVSEFIRKRVYALLKPWPRLNIDEVEQDVFLQISQKIGQFKVEAGVEPLTSFRRWSCTIAHHHVVDLIRKDAAGGPRHKPLEKAGGYRPEEPTASRFVEQLLDELSAEDQHLVALYSIEEVTFSEMVPKMVEYRKRMGIEDTEGLSEEALQRRWWRIREKLRAVGSGTK